MMLIKILKSIFYNPFQNGVHFDVFQTFSYAQSYILYVCKLSMSEQNDVNCNIKICILQYFLEWSTF